MAKSLFGRLQDELDAREQEQDRKDSTMMDTLALPAPMQKIITRVIRHGELTLEQIATEIKSTPQEVGPLVDDLVTKRFLEVDESGPQKLYKPYLGRKRGRKVPVNIWDSLDSKVTR